MAAPLRGAVRRGAQGYRHAVVSARWFIVAGWIALTVLISVVLPTAGGGGGDIGDLLPPGSPAVAVQLRSLQQFQIPVQSETSVVVHDPDGLSILTRADVVLWALTYAQAYVRGAAPPGDGHIIAAVPIPTSSPETAETFLYVSGGTSLAQTKMLAQQYAAYFHNQRSVQTYVTGIVPAQVQQPYYLNSRLHPFEIATLLLIAVVVGITFRSLVAPFVVLVAAGLGYLVAICEPGRARGAVRLRPARPAAAVAPTGWPGSEPNLSWPGTSRARPVHLTGRRWTCTAPSS